MEEGFDVEVKAPLAVYQSKNKEKEYMKSHLAQLTAYSSATLVTSLA
jgi:hypothetical protein